MSESAIELVRRAFDHFGKRQLDAMMETVHPDVVFDPAFVQGSFEGRDAVRALFEANRDPKDGWRASDLEFESFGDSVLVTGRMAVPSSLGGLHALPVAWVLSVHDGRIIRLDGYVDRRQALSVLEPDGGASSAVPG
jgi:ketosteroid isomerase-like protein